jgi:hypothetical protein
MEEIKMGELRKGRKAIIGKPFGNIWDIKTLPIKADEDRIICNLLYKSV